MKSWSPNMILLIKADLSKKGVTNGSHNHGVNLTGQNDAPGKLPGTLCASKKNSDRKQGFS